MNKQKYLKTLDIKGSQNVPDVCFNSLNGKLLIKGRSVLENTIHFFEPIIKWIDEYCKNPAEKTELCIEMDYFNTSSSKFILSIFEKLQNLHTLGKQVEIIWRYNDEDSQELGKDYSMLLEVPFKFVKQ